MRAWIPSVLSVTALALVITLPFGHADDSDAWSLEARVPASSFGLISVEAVGKLGQRLEQTSIAKFFNSPEMAAFMAPIKKELKSFTEGDGGQPKFLEDVPPIFMEMFEQLQGLRGQLAVAVIGMEAGAEMPAMAASLDFGPHLEDFKQFIARLKAEMGDDGERIQTFERDGRTWWQVETGGPTISATTVDTAFVLATDPATLQSIITAAPEGSLGDSTDFKAVRAKAGGDDLGLFVYANVPSLMGKFADEMPRDAKQIASALGVDTVKAVAYGMAFKGDGFMDTLIIHTPGADHGLAPLGLLPPLREKALASVPANAFLYSESSLPLGDLLPRIKTFISKDMGESTEDFDRHLSEMGQQLGVDIPNELLAGLGNGTAVYASLPDTGGLYPEVAVMLRVKDAAAYKQTFQRFATGLAGMLTEQGEVIASTRTIQYEGHDLNLFELQAARGRGVIPFTPTWTIRDNWLTITLVPYSMKELILRTSGATTGANLGTQEDFQALMAHRPANAGAIEYWDLQAIVNLLYDTGVPLLQTMVKPNMLGDLPFELDFAQLPPARAVRKYFRSMMAFASWTKDGIQISMHAPIPLVLVIAVAAGVGVAYLSGGRTSRRVNRPAIRIKPAVGMGTRARMGAEQVLRYVRLYRLENAAYPKSIQELVKMGIMRTAPLDPWGHAFELVPADDGNSMGVRSAGPDGNMLTKDDILVGIK